jgi:Rrf2 family iron-sulfur cluster assembly transcriptional regulator
MRMPLLPHKIILAIGAVVDIALHSGKEPVSSRDLANRLQLPGRHLEPVLQTFVRKGILQGVRGMNGGYKLAKARDAISVYDLSKAVKETEEPNKEFPGLLGAVVVPTLAQAEQCFGSALKRITVEDLVRAASLQLLESYKARASATP